jgi:hypothetical protein
MNFAKYAVLALLIASCGGAARAGDGAEPDVETQIRAAYIYKFATYVDWPPAAPSPSGAALTIGIIGADGLADEFKKISVGRQVKSRPVQVRIVKADDQLTGLHILYIGAGAGGRARTLIDGAVAQAVLTVAEAGTPFASDSVINFVKIDDRIRFEVSLVHAATNGLKISSRLLVVAYRVDGKAP